MQEKYLTIKNQVEKTIVIERSKFICKIKSVDTEEQAKEFVNEIKALHPFATHNCYAYHISTPELKQKFSDDGEPQGTAGLPMLEALKNKGLTNVCAVVTRYFGGIKLGAGGLVRAYSSSVSETITSDNIIAYEKCLILSFSVEYDGYSKILSIAQDSNVSIVKTEFNDKIDIKVAISKPFYNKFVEILADVFKGKISHEVLGEDFFSTGEKN